MICTVAGSGLLVDGKVHALQGVHESDRLGEGFLDFMAESGGVPGANLEDCGGVLEVVGDRKGLVDVINIWDMRV
jgi:hypothetical protein